MTDTSKKNILSISIDILGYLTKNKNLIKFDINLN